MKPHMEIACSKLASLLQRHPATAGMSIRIHGDHLILGRVESDPTSGERETVESVRLTRLNASTFGLSVRRHHGRWERTPFSGSLKDMVDAIHGFMQHLVAEW